MLVEPYLSEIDIRAIREYSDPPVILDMAADPKSRPVESTNGQANGRLSKRTQPLPHRRKSWSSQWFSISAR